MAIDLVTTVTPSQAARDLGCTASSVRDLCARGRLVAEHRNGQWAIDPASVAAYAQQRNGVQWQVREQVYETLGLLAARQGKAPLGVAEIAAALDRSPAAVMASLDTLAEDGLVMVSPQGRARATPAGVALADEWAAKGLPFRAPETSPSRRRSA